MPFEPQITARQIREAVNKLAPDKAPGPDEIANNVLKNTLPIIERHLQALMQASINLGHFPTCFKNTDTIVLRKPGKPDYTQAKAYRPIALENTVGKILESIMADIMSYLTETHELLPAHHYGGRPGRSADDAMMILTETIYKTWKEKKVYIAIFMDVAGAFNNVHHKWLIHNLSKRRMPTAISRWISSFLQNRNTQLQFSGTKSESIPTPAGIPQGSPLSPLLYMYYNADLLDIPKDREMGLGFIDDIVYGVQGDTDKANARKLKLMLKKAEEWRKKHGAQFETSKYVLVHYTRNYRKATKASITINGTTVEPSGEAKYLGVIFDQKLNFKSHLQYISKKGTNAAMALSSITKINWGAQYTYARQLFKAVITTRTDYATSIWHQPKSDGELATIGQIQKLTTIQRLGMKAITGCYRTTPTAAMEIESDLQPIRIRLQTKVLQSVTRMQSLSVKHPLQAWITNAALVRTAQVRHRSNLENVMHQFPHMAEKIERIEPYIRPPWWIPKVEIQIDATKDTAKDLHNKKQEHKNAATVSIYTDGSGVENRVGAAAHSPTMNTTIHQHLGSEKHYNVFIGEVTAVQLAVEMLRDDHEFRTCYIYSDSQAAIKAVDKPQRQSGQEITWMALMK